MRNYVAVGLCLSGLLGSLVWWAGTGQTGEIQERVGTPKGGKVEKSDAAWRRSLTADQYYVTRQKGTEQPYTGAYWNTKTPGVYQYVCCGQPLFDAGTKFDSGTGWPSYWQPIDPEMVSLHADNSALGRRTEVTCSRCAAHLGHVFSDGPAPTGLRYCINSVALQLTPHKR